jgi:hypothetical protein
MIFKKHISLLLVFFLLVSNIGLAFDVHYCGGEVASVALKTGFESENFEKNCCGTVEEKVACCKDKVVHFQKKSDNLLLKVFSLAIDVPFLCEQWEPITFVSVVNFKSKIVSSYYYQTHAPPLFKLYNQYIFYA